MPARRVRRPSPDAGAGPLVTFTFDGRESTGVEGEPLAAALLAADRPILSRSFRFHRPRGLMCSTGQCGWCECEVDGVPSVRSCQVPVREGLVARGEHAFPSVELDVLSLVGLVSRWIPPTFYHHRFLRPRQLRKRYLDVLRRFGGRGRLDLGRNGSRRAGRTPIGDREARRVETDVLVVGGGRAGLLAALGAAETGARVVLLEADATIGGGWRTERGRYHSGVSLGQLAEDARASGIEVMTGVQVVGWYDGQLTAIEAHAHLEIEAGAVIAATGSYERVPLVPGADRPGVMAARMAIGLCERYGILPGDRVLLVGSGEELGTAGELVAGAGAAELIGPIDTDALVGIRGRTRVIGADVRLGGRRQHIAADAVVFGDRSPNLDLILAAGAAVEWQGDTLVPSADAAGRTTVASLAVVGSAAGRPIVDALAADAARTAGQVAGRAATGRKTAAEPMARPVRPTVARRPGPTAIARGAISCFCEDVRAWEIRAELAAGYTDPELAKRRTGALTGPCQGKLCLQSFACLTRSASNAPVSLPTARPPLRPVRLGDLVATPADPSRPPER